MDSDEYNDDIAITACKDIWVGANAKCVLDNCTAGNVYVNANSYSKSNKGFLEVVNATFFQLLCLFFVSYFFRCYFNTTRIHLSRNKFISYSNNRFIRTNYSIKTILLLKKLLLKICHLLLNTVKVMIYFGLMKIRLFLHVFL